MKRLLLLSISLFLISAPTWAQTTAILDKGSKTTFNPAENHTQTPPLPPRKPPYIKPAAQSAIPSIIKPPNPRDITVINQNTAIGIALDHAPPAKDFKVSAYDFNGTPSYSVMFRTENGRYEVIIDAVKGRVLDKGYLQ